MLTKREILEVLVIAAASPELQNPLNIGACSFRTSIFKITPKNGIIFIWGDSETGFNHLHERHSFWSEKYYWKQEGDKVVLDNPSKFKRDSLPIEHYIRLADELYSKQNLNNEKNKSKELFDLYTGFVEENGKTKFHMLLYKDTKIIHTLYPHKKNNNKKIHLNLRRGKASGKLWFQPFTGSTIGVPYRNNSGDAIYSFQVIKNFDTMIEVWLLINEVTSQSMKLHERKIEKIIEFNLDVDLLNDADLTDIEKVIKRQKIKRNNSK